MKKVLFFILLYIFTALFLMAIVACFFVLYPGSPADSVYVTTSLRTMDVFLYSCLSLLPFISVLSLTVILLRLIKTSSHTILELLTYIFLCFVAWLIIIPSCIFYQPEEKVSLLVTGEAHSPVSIFFESGTTKELAQNLEAQRIEPPSVIVEIFEKLLFLRDIGRSAGEEGRITYLLFASMGLALSGLYMFCSLSSWKLINVTVVLLLWCSIVWCNIEIYERNWGFAFDNKWIALIVNGIFFLLMLFISNLVALMRRKARRGVK